MTKFLVITFADLKKYKFFYWFAFPAFVSKPAWEISDPGWTNADGAFSPDAVCVSGNVRDLLIAKDLSVEIDSSTPARKSHTFLSDKVQRQQN